MRSSDMGSSVGGGLAVPYTPMEEASMRAWCSCLSILACSPDSRGSEPVDDAVLGVVGSGFWDHWGDGRAEVSAYRLATPRYGQSREGRVTLVFVTETFDDVQRVKSDDGRGDTFPVLKVNEIRDFQTGIYDYNVMTSTFLRLDGEAAWGEPVKVSMTMQEWCGHVYEHVVPRGDTLGWTQHSYFDGEAPHIPAQILRSGRRRIWRLLAWRPQLPVLCRLLPGL